MVNKRRWRVRAREGKKGEKLHIKSSAVREPHTPAYRWRISLQPASGGGGRYLTSQQQWTGLTSGVTSGGDKK